MRKDRRSRYLIALKLKVNLACVFQIGMEVLLRLYVDYRQKIQLLRHSMLIEVNCDRPLGFVFSCC